MGLSTGIEAVEITVHIGLLVFLYCGLFIGFMEFRGMFQRYGLDAQVMGLLLVGALVSMIGDFPLFVSDGLFLSINFGGAIIPIILSILLVHRSGASPFLVGAGVAVVSVCSYLTSSIVPGYGIASEFPDYFIPILVAVGLSLLMFRRDMKRTLAAGYAMGTLGALVGADLVRLPDIFKIGTAGSIGGAGVLDLVFLSGLSAIAIILLFSPRSDRQLPRTFPENQKVDLKVNYYMDQSEKAILDGRPSRAVKLARKAVDEKARHVGGCFGLSSDVESVLTVLKGPVTGIMDYRVLRSISQRPDVTRYDAEKALITARILLGVLEHLRGKAYAPLWERAVAFLIDLTIMIAVLALLLFFVVGFLFEFDFMRFSNSMWFFAFIFWVIIAQTLYFTFFEWIWGQSPGKHIMHLRVVSEEQMETGFLEAFSRNVVRFVDFILFFYLISLVVMLKNPANQRIGDMVARTVVIRIPKDHPGYRPIL